MSNDEMVGFRSGRLTVLREEPTEKRGSYWRCECDCGKEVVVRGSFLRSGKTKSCGCLRNELSSQRLTKRNRTHGESHSRLYGIWSEMHKRCKNPRHWAYDRYGGRGITVCEEWSNYGTFSTWAKEHGYADSLTIDRRENDGPYSPQNCQWVSRREQARNRSNTLHQQVDGRQIPLSELAESHNISYTTLYSRIHHYGWTIDRALRTPIRGGGGDGITKLSKRDIRENS